MTREPEASGVPPGALAASYVTNFAALAASSPFLAVYLDDLGIKPEMAAELLAACLLVRVVAIPPWTLLADRRHSSGAALRLSSAGAMLAFGALLFTHSRAVVPLALLAFAAFRAPFGPLLDALMLHGARASGRAFGAVRAWGTAGYALSAVLTGALVARFGTRAVLYVGLVLLVAAFASACAVGRGDASPEAPSGGPGLFLAFARRPRLALLLGIVFLIQTGLAPYDALFPAYLTRLAGATAAGAAVALGAASEFVFLLAGPSLARRLGPERLLAAACAASAVRWAAIALVTNPVALVLLQTLHALSFGAFYMSAVILVDRESPPGLRASAQGLLASLCFGVAASLGLALAGFVEHRADTPAVFEVAAIAAIAATVASLLLSRPSLAPGVAS